MGSEIQGTSRESRHEEIILRLYIRDHSPPIGKNEPVLPERYSPNDGARLCAFYPGRGSVPG